MHRPRPFLLQYVYVFFPLVISSCWAKWNSQTRICPAGNIVSVTRDENGDFVFVNYPDDGYENNNSNDQNLFSNNGTNRRNLRQSAFASQSAIKIVETRYLAEAQVEDDDFSNASKYSNNTIFHVRPCLCHPTTQDAKPYQTDQEIWLCPSDTGSCGIFPSDLEEPVDCYSDNVQEDLVRNAWPLILLWYFGLVIICCCTIHGHTAKEYLRSCYNTNHNVEFMDRMLAGNLSAPTNQWSWWTWQRYRFEQNLVLQVQWIWRHQEYERQRHRREQGLPPPQLEMKTKRFIMEEEHQYQQDLSHEDEDYDSINEPICTICFVPLEEGDRIGALECRHNFHVPCLKSWLARRNVCPLCSQPVAKRRQRPEEPTTEIALATTPTRSLTLVDSQPRPGWPTFHNQRQPDEDSSSSSSDRP